MTLKQLMLAAGMILSAAFAFADNDTEFGVDDDLTVWGTQGSTADADVEIKGFTVFGSTTAGNLAVYSGTGSVFMGGALEVSSNTYLRGSVVVGTTTSQGIFAVKDNFVVTSGGNVGIGTLQPATKLHVNGTFEADGAGYLGGNLTVYGSYMNLTNDNSSFYIYGNPVITRNTNELLIGGGIAGGQLHFYGSGSEKITLLSNGNVGIGTTNPAQKLEINGGSISLARLASDNNSYYIGTSGTSGIFATGSSGGGYMEIQDIAEGGNSSQAIHFITHHTGISHARRMTINKDGDVGIGTTPQATLDVNGFIKLAKNSSAPATYDANHNGSLALTSGNRICVCSGSSWVFASDGTTSCSWE